MKKRIISLLLCLALCGGVWLPGGALAAADSPHSWAAAEVREAISNGLVPSDLQNAYDQAITRQEFCRLAVNLVEVVEEKSIAQVLKDKELKVDAKAFTDTTDEAVLQCSALGIVNGYEDGTFLPGGSITRQEAAKMLYETAKALGVTSGGANLSFGDTGSILPYAITSVKFVSGQGIMNGVNNNMFDPTGVYTREQAYMTFDRLLKAIEGGGGSTTGAALDATAIFNLCSPAVCYIEVYDRAGQAVASGSAFAVSSDGRLVTNYHVIEGVYSAKAKFPDGTVYDVKKVMAYDVARDVAVLKIDATGLTTLKLGSSSAIVSGETVYTLGSPQGLDNTIANGIISTVEREVDGQKYIQITAPISPGSSGGALLNAKGECIGITTGTLAGQNLNFAVPIDDVKSYLDKDVNLTLEKLATARASVQNASIVVLGQVATYTGQVVAGGTPDGKGKAQWPDGSYYDGEFQQGLPHGTGTLYAAQSGFTYSGGFVEGQPEGKGTMKFTNGDQYTGDFLDGYKHGKGTYTYAAGDKYEGDFVNDYFEGEGTYTFASGGKYVGGFYWDQFDGYGTLYDKDGKVVKEGYWSSGAYYGASDPYASKAS